MPGTTPNYGLRYPVGTDAPNVATDIQNLASDVDSKVPAVPIGASLEWDYAAASIPSWALLQYGQAISRTTYAALAALASAASYPHGSGDGSTTFNIADKRGRVSAGKDDMGGTAASRITAAVSGTAGTVLGAAVGAEGVTLATAQIPSHAHTGGTNTVSADHSHYTTTGGRSAAHQHYFDYNQDGATSGIDRMVSVDHAGQYNKYTSTETADHTHGGQSGGISANHTHQVYSEGGGGAHLNMSPTIIVNKILRVL